jgi:hypothetical protein
LAINFKEAIWRSFNGWLRTIRKTQEPSELVVATVLRKSLPNFLRAGANGFDWVKFLIKNIDTSRDGPISNAA